MIPGPNLVYECPKCKRTVWRESLISGNTLGSTLYSDGKRISPMLPEFPFIAKCKECNTFYWLDNKNRIGEFEDYEIRDYKKPKESNTSWLDNIMGEYDEHKYDHIKSKFENEWKKPKEAEFLSPNEYFEAIKSKIYSNKDEELCLRLNLWWAFNDRTRDYKDIFLTEEDKDIYESNCIALIEMLDKNDIRDKITIAELYRNLGKYVECNKILNTIKDKKYAMFKKILKKECEKNNKNVVEISEKYYEKEKIVMFTDKECQGGTIQRGKSMIRKFLDKLWRFVRGGGVGNSTYSAYALPFYRYMDKSPCTFEHYINS
jgi:hypothetical protein